MYLLDNPIRRYAWGSHTAMAKLFGRAPSGSPEAEMWIGAHPDSPSTARVEDRTAIGLDLLIDTRPNAFLGDHQSAAFGGRLPFLAKILAADSPLSLQVHPTLEQASHGYAAENTAGIPQTSEQRNYRDANHKPEMIVALSSFDALCGLRTRDSALRLYSELGGHFSASKLAVPEAIEVVIGLLDLDSDGLRQAFSYLIHGGAHVSEAVDAAADLLAGIPGVDEGFGTLVDLQRSYPGDPGVLISLLLNRVTLKPGEALCLPAGNVHAYLKGLGFEVMASSDNVLRGGLTAKHIDIQEFLSTVDFRPLPLPLLEAQTPAPGVIRWTPPFGEFQVERLSLSAGDPVVTLRQNGPVLLVVIEGAGRIQTPVGETTLEPGQSVFVPANEYPITLGATGNRATPLLAFAVTIGDGPA